MQRTLWLAALLLGCVVERAPAPLVAGTGVSLAGSTVSVDLAAALPACTEDQLLAKSPEGWGCADATPASTIDPDSTPVLSGCVEGQVIERSATGWRCSSVAALSEVAALSDRIGALEDVPDVDVAPLVARLAALEAKTDFTPCVAGTAARWNGTTWNCESLPLVDPTLPGRVSALEDVLRLPPGETIGASRARVDRAVPNGACIEVEHGWGTAAVGYSAWISEPNGPGGQPVWVPVQPGYEAGTTNLALGRPASASSSGQSPLLAVDGIDSTAWEAMSGQSAGWWQVDLGTVAPVTSVQLFSSRTTDAWAATAWRYEVSTDGVTFASVAVAEPTTCSKPGTCESYIAANFPAGTSARFVRVVVTASTLGVRLVEFRVFSTRFTVSQPDVDTVRFCNYHGAPRDLALRVWR